MTAHFTVVKGAPVYAVYDSKSTYGTATARVECMNSLQAADRVRQFFGDKSKYWVVDPGRNGGWF